MIAARHGFVIAMAVAAVGETGCRKPPPVVVKTVVKEVPNILKEIGIEVVKEIAKDEIISAVKSYREDKTPKIRTDSFDPGKLNGGLGGVLGNGLPNPPYPWYQGGLGSPGVGKFTGGASSALVPITPQAKSKGDAIGLQRWSADPFNPSYPHVISMLNGFWMPETGYVWADGPAGFRKSPNSKVRWNTGATHLLYPHIHASSVEECWEPDVGYRWVNALPGALRKAELSADLNVQWNPGSSWPGDSNVLAAPAEGRWRPAPGYTWVSDAPSITGVRWDPGSHHPVYPNIVASAEMGKWSPATGYTWVRESPTDLAVVPVSKP